MSGWRRPVLVVLTLAVALGNALAAVAGGTGAGGDGSSRAAEGRITVTELAADDPAIQHFGVWEPVQWPDGRAAARAPAGSCGSTSPAPGPAGNAFRKTRTYGALVAPGVDPPFFRPEARR